MMPEIENLPEVSFIDHVTLDTIQAQMINDYEQKYEQLTKKKVALRRADPVTFMLYACSVQIYQALLFVDRAGKQDLLKYSYGEFLDNIAAYKGVTRLPAQAAEVKVRFTLSAVQESAIGIPLGTKLTDGDIYFETAEYAEIPAGEEYADVPCICQTAGIAGSGLAAGSINILVEPIPYVAKAVNIEESRGGSDIEDDESLAERVYLAPASYSTAGPTDAYVHHTKSYGASIGSVNVTSPIPGDVEVRVLLKDGTLPSDALLESLLEYLNDETIRPLTDHVKVLAPETMDYNLVMTYYIARSDSAKAVAIQNAVNTVVNEYNQWQTFTIGRDINPSELIRRVVNAGAKRAVVTLPEFTVVPPTTVARVENVSVTYGGVEDD
nr:baseplate J/gp47 family protein [uncultured Schaedlerella sp.]